MPKRPLPGPLPPDLHILDDETKARFGYYARDVHPGSPKKVVATCQACQQPYERKRQRVTERCGPCDAEKDYPRPDLSAVLDDEATFAAYGYHLADTLPASKRWVIGACTTCGGRVERRRWQYNTNTLCVACALKERPPKEAQAPTLDVSTVLDDNETFARFGYHVSDVRPGARVPVVYVCTGGCDAQHVRTRQRLSTSTSCATCSAKAASVKRAATIAERFGPEGMGAATISAKRAATLKANHGPLGSGALEILKKRFVTLAANHGPAGMADPAIIAGRNATIVQHYGPLGWKDPAITTRRTQTIRARLGPKGLGESAVVAKRNATMQRHLGPEGWKHPSLAQKRNLTRLRNAGPAGWADPKAHARRFASILARYGQRGFAAIPRTYGRAALDLAALLRTWGLDVTTEVPLPNGQRLDVVVPSKHLAIEYCGLYWHNERSKTPRLKPYHRAKMLAAKAQGLRTITLFEDEWLSRRAQVEGRLKAILGIATTRLMARKCALREITHAQAYVFLEQHHLQGGTSLHLQAWGLYHADDLIATLTLAPHHRQGHTGVVVLNRLCIAHGVSVAGGASRLTKHALAWAKAKGYARLISWSDDRWSEGDVYETTGFTLAEQLPPDYSYVNLKSPKARISKQSQRKSASKCPEGLTELAWATQRGLARIWDCGHKRWEIQL